MDRAPAGPADEQELLHLSPSFLTTQSRILESIASGSDPREYLDLMAGLVESSIASASCMVSLSIGPLAIAGQGPLFAASPVGDELASDHGLRIAPVIVDDVVLGEIRVVLRPDRTLSAQENGIVSQIAHLAAVAAQREQSQATLQHLAMHDPLTSLPNRSLLFEHLGRAVKRGARFGTTTAVLFIDLDRFKVVNDSVGHSLGDALLQQVAQRLASVIRPEDILARFGGDEFVVVCEDLAGEQDAVALGERLLEVLSEGFDLADRQVVLSASIGIAVTGAGDKAPEALIRDADAAMYRAKQSGRGRMELFDDELGTGVGPRLEMESAFREAVTHKGIGVLYQPLIRLTDNRIVGLEALARWKDRPDVGPADFVALAEDMDLISALGRNVLKQVSSDLGTWQEACPGNEFFISVNLSPRQLADPEFVTLVKTILKQRDLDPGRLCMEITEGTLLDDTIHGHHLDDLEKLGVKLAIDDFGTGYSSFSYLKRLHIDFLKIDRSLIQGLGDDPQDAAIVSAIVGLSRSLGIGTIAEGVEESKQRDVLRSVECDVGQGFMWGAPMTSDRIQRLLLDEVQETSAA